MRSLAVAFAIFSALVVSPAFAATQIPIQKYSGDTTGRYIVQMKDGANKAGLQSQIMQAANGQVITHDWSIINGFAGAFEPAALDMIRSSPHVQSVSEDGIVTVSVVQTKTTWGLRRISNRKRIPNGSSPSLLSYDYTYPGSAGSGVDIYVVDTGVRTTHQTFKGRASWGETFGGYAQADGNGHGTHVAGTAAGSDYGVAKSAKIIAVKVLSDQGSGSTSDIISGLNWVKQTASKSGRPSVVNMSLGGPANLVLDNAVKSLVDSGIHVAVAAGNSNTPANLVSPARAPGAVAVASTNITDNRSSFSNWGTAVAIFAPGENIISSWNTDDTATNEISGTSMATPHVAGLIALFISQCTSNNGPNPRPSKMRQILRSAAVPNVIGNVPPLTDNLLAQIPSSPRTLC